MHIKTILMSLFLAPVDFLMAAEEPKGRIEYWKAVLNHNDRLTSSIEIPRYPEYYNWKITGTIAGEEVYKGDVPAVYLDRLTGDIVVVGSVKIGTALTLDYFQTRHSHIYYEIAKDSVNFKGVVREPVYVSGKFVTRDLETSFKPPKTIKDAKEKTPPR